jgi:hypothetical protein
MVVINHPIFMSFGTSYGVFLFSQEEQMKKMIIMLFVLMLSAGSAFAEGGKNQGTTGTGTTSTGIDNQGTAAQDRTGR